MPFPMQQQKNTLWCWAAVASSIDAYFRPVGFAEQCDVAKKVLGHTDCCIEPTPTRCNKRASLRTALEKVGHFDQIVEGWLTFDEIRRQRDLNLVVGVRTRWRDGKAHFVVIAGYAISESGQEWVVVKDPLYEDENVPYEEFRTSYHTNDGVWTHSYLVKP